MKDPRYIAVEGPIGVGKTSFARLLAEETKARLILEEAEDNPFLREFYKDRAGAAFQTQMFFLLSRYKQQQAEFRQFDLFNRNVVSDYIFAKDRIFAHLNLDDNELMLYGQIYSLLEPKTVKPDLVIYLQADSKTLMERIRLRGRDYEGGMTAEYVEGLNEAYNRFFFNYSDTPLLVIQTSEIDFVKDRAGLQDLMRQIDRAGSGTLYYRPMPGTER